MLPSTVAKQMLDKITAKERTLEVILTSSLALEIACSLGSGDCFDLCLLLGMNLLCCFFGRVKSALIKYFTEFACASHSSSLGAFRWRTGCRI